MNKPEQKFWRNEVRPALQRITALNYERMELRLGKAGFPDVFFNYHGPGVIELKVSTNEADNVWDLSEWTEEQRGWAKRFCHSGMRGFLMVRGPSGVVMANVNHVIDHSEVTWADFLAGRAFNFGQRVNTRGLASVLHGHY